MSKGRKPACSSSTSQGFAPACGLYNSETDISDNLSEKQVFLAGNRIGHSPDNPSWYSIPTHHKKRSELPVKVIHRIKDAYFSPSNILKDLQNQNNRQVRTEKRNVSLDMLAVMVYYMDDKTLRIGRFMQGKWFDLSVNAIAKIMKITEGRARRAFRHLVQTGYIVTNAVKSSVKDNKYVSVPWIKKITPKLFTDLGFKWRQVMSLQAYKREREAKKIKKMETDRSSIKEVTNYIKESLDCIFIRKLNDCTNKKITNHPPDVPISTSQHIKFLKNILS